MSVINPDTSIALAEVVLPAADLQANIDFFIQQLGFRLDSIMPADNPRLAQLSGHGLQLRLDSNFSGSPGTLRIGTEDSDTDTSLMAPNGTRIEFEPARLPLVIPELQPALAIQPMTDDPGVWQTGRAGMHYRDLIPDRQGGRFIASHIRIPEGGPVPDNVHYHAIRFQMIYCYRGWVRLVYEGQGEPFIMTAGDCVLQPPLIRHRVLEACDGLEVIEIGSPAEHITGLDHSMKLPGIHYPPGHDFSGQRYHMYRAAAAVWQADHSTGLLSSSFGLADATSGLAEARILRATDSLRPAANWLTHEQELAFWFVLDGSLELQLPHLPVTELSAGDALVIPAGMPYLFKRYSADLQLLETSLPAQA